MLRPSIIAFSLLIAVSLTGCSNAYRRMYSPQRSYFKPEKDQPKPAEVLPAPVVVPPAGSGPAPVAPPPAAAPSAPAPAIPGL